MIIQAFNAEAFERKVLEAEHSGGNIKWETFRVAISSSGEMAYVVVAFYPNALCPKK